MTLHEMMYLENKKYSEDKKSKKKVMKEAPDMYGLPTDDEINRKRSWYESDPNRKKIFKIADDFKKEFGIKAKTKYRGYGYNSYNSTKGKEDRIYQVSIDTGRDALRPLFIDGKMYKGLKPEYQDRFDIFTDTKPEWALEDGESQIEINPDYVIIRLKATMDKDEAEYQRDRDQSDYSLAFKDEF